MKTCSMCGVSKALANFSKRGLSADGYLASCKPCTSDAKKRQRAVLLARSDEEIEAAAAARPPRACRICKEVKTFEGFTRDRGRRDGRGTVCLPCAASLTKHYNSLIDPAEMKRRKADYFSRTRAKSRAYRLKSDFGLTRAQYEEMLESQGGVCAICGDPETRMRNDAVQELCVDHCHVSGSIRGLLCGHCNQGLGHFRDIPDRMRAAADYIEFHAALAEEHTA